MKLINYNFEKTLKLLGIKTRPNASSGFWVMFLLPVSLIVSYFRNPTISSLQYKHVTLISAGFVISSIILIFHCVKSNNFNNRIPYIITALYTASLFYTCSNTDILYGLICGFTTVFGYIRGILWLLKACPQSFTFGEASLIVQGIILFLYTSILNIAGNLRERPTKVCHISNIILQIGITGIMLICYLSYKVEFFRKTIPFYLLTTIVISLWIISPLHAILQTSPILWILNLLTGNFSTMTMMAFWVLCLVLAVLAVFRQIQSGKRANSKTRKIFHILAVVVMVPGLIDQCSVLYLATGVIFAIFVGLETLRILNLPPLGTMLQDGFVVFADSKDVGGLSLTPLYLLVGCSLPLWIHPQPCDVTDSAGFHLLPLISGLLTVGIGDTLASICGITFGKTKWFGTEKTIEGTIASIFGQIATVMILMNFGFILKTNETIIRALLAAMASSLIEAKTDQVDNLVLPLISYIILV